MWGVQLVSLAKKLTPGSSVGLKRFSQNKNGELKAKRKKFWEENNLQYNRNGLATALLKYRRLKT